jgi:hypothetical protein
MIGRSIVSNTNFSIFIHAEGLATAPSKWLGHLGLVGGDVPIKYEGAI